MTRFKFRAWHFLEKKMYYDVIVCPDGWVYVEEFNDKGEPIERGLGDDGVDCHVMQWIGRCDRNGNDVYESDIYEQYAKIKKHNTGEVREQKTIGVVTWGEYKDDEYNWSTDCFMIGDIPVSSEISTDKYVNPYWIALEERCGVIGNVWEHPHLLKS